MGGIDRTGGVCPAVLRLFAPLAGACMLLGMAPPASALPVNAALPASIDTSAQETTPKQLQDMALHGDESFPPELNALVESGKYPEALTLLMTRPDLLTDEKGFMLEIHLLLKTRQYDKAMILLEHRLAQDPYDGLARFEVAEIHFRRGQDRQAMLDYRLALAGTLDDVRTRTAQARLQGFVRRKSWHTWMGASFSPNNNINDTSDITRLALFGLPFSESAPGADKSGVAFSGYIAAGKLMALSPGFGIRTNILAAASHDPGRMFDSRSLSIQTGPEWTFGHITHLSVSGRAIVQWLGKDVGQSGGGASLHLDTYGGNQLWAGDLSADRLNVRYNHIGVGWNSRMEIKRVRYLDASALWLFDATVSRRGAAFDSKTFSEGQVRVGRLFQTPLSTFVYLELAGRVRRFDRNPAFSGLRRTDDFGQFTARFSKRDLILFGAVPYVAVIGSHNESDINVYDNNRLRFDFGFTSDF